MSGRKVGIVLMEGAPRRIGAEAVACPANHAFCVTVELRQAGGQATARRQVFKHADEELGRGDVLVNNAGIQQPGTRADFDDLAEINPNRSFKTMRRAAMRMHGGSCIVNLLPNAAIMPQPRYGVHKATKAGIEALTAMLAKERMGQRPDHCRQPRLLTTV